MRSPGPISRGFFFSNHQQAGLVPERLNFGHHLSLKPLLT